MEDGVAINISQELLRNGVLTPVIRKFIMYLVEYDIYDNFIKLVTLLRKYEYQEPPQYHINAQDIFNIYILIPLRAICYYHWNGELHINDYRFNHFADLLNISYWRAVSSLWYSYLNE